MSATLYVIPAPGLTVVDPAASEAERFLPAAGRQVDATEYWHRRLRDGDVTLGIPPASEQAAA